jgi:hypothetical protein
MATIKNLEKQTSLGKKLLRIVVHPDVLAFLKNSANEYLASVEAAHGVRLIFTSDCRIHREKFFIHSGESDSVELRT